MAENIAETLSELVVPISKVKGRKRNPRRGDVETIKESLEVNGQYRPIVVNQRTGEVLAGNHTLKAAKALGWKKIAATFVDADEEQAARIVLVDNRANDVASYDDAELVGLLKEFEDLKGTGYTNADITTLLQELGAAASKEGQTDPDDVPDAPNPEDAITKPGDIWQLGDHRLICGDSTDQATIQRLMDGRQADLLLTDPPYGVSYKTDKHRPIENDDKTGADLQRFLTAALGAAAATMPGGAPAYVFLSDGPSHHIEFERAMAENNMKQRQTLIWAKDRFTLGRQDYNAQHEPILYGWKEGAAHKWYGAFDKSTLEDEAKNPSKMTKDELVELVRFISEQVETSVIRCPKPAKSELHPTTKPVALLERLINNSSQYADAVLDSFGGSGSTLIACERSGRHAFLCELDPIYCDVIVKRWEEHTGRKAERLPAQF